METQRYEVKGYDRDENGNGAQAFTSFVYASSEFSARDAVKNKRYGLKRSNVTITGCEVVR